MMLLCRADIIEILLAFAMPLLADAARAGLADMLMLLMSLRRWPHAMRRLRRH